MTQPASLGSRIRSFRERLELTPADLARQTGLAESLILSIEMDEVYPSIGTMTRLARALGQRLGTFMDDNFVPDPLIVRASSREGDIPSHKPSSQSAGYSYAPLGRGKTDRHIEPFYIELAPDSKEVLSSHEGEEFIVVVSGVVELTYGDARYILNPGDSAHYNSVVHHLVKAHGGKPAAIYAVIFIPF